MTSNRTSDEVFGGCECDFGADQAATGCRRGGLAAQERGGTGVGPCGVGCEIRLGILLLAAGKQRSALEKWFDLGVERMVCLSWDAATALQWAALLARLRSKGEAMPLKDSRIAASAATHQLTVATRNVADFKNAEVRVVNPFSS